MAGRGTLVAALLALLMATGCSGGDGGPASLTPAQFRSRAAAVCTSFTHRLAKLEAPADVAGLTRQGARAIALEQQEVAALRALPAPDSMAARVSAMLGAVDRAIADSRMLIAAARTGRAERVAAAAGTLRGHLTAANTLARALRLGRCVIAG